MRLRYTLDNITEGEHVTTYSPKGWEETELVLKRHDKYDGIFKDYTVKVDFFCGAGKEYVDNIYDTQGIDATVEILIEMDCDDSGEYETLYDGQLIMKSYDKIQAAPEYTRVNLEQSGILQTVLNRLETKIDLTKLETLDGTALSVLTFGPYELTMHSKKILESGRVEMLTGAVAENYIPIPTVDTLYITFPMETASYAEFSDFIGYPPPYITSVQGTPETKALYLNETDETVVVDFEYSFVGTIQEFLNRNRNYTLKILYRIDDSNDPSSPPPPAVVLHDYGFKSPLANVNMTQAVNLSGTLSGLSFPPNYGLHIYFLLNNYLGNDLVSPSTSTVTMTFSEMKVTGTTESVTDPTTTNAFAIFETGADISRKITNQADAFRSNYLGRKNSEPYAYDENGCGSFDAITNGFQIRGFPLADRPVYLSMKEYFDSLNAIHCLGLGIKQEGDNTFIEIEPKDYFYRNEVILTLNNIRGLRTTLDERFFFNRFKIGFKEWRKEGLNGLDEFCTTHDYALLLKSISNELEAQSDFIAGPYAIEKQRRQRYYESATTDEDYDDKTFIISLNRSVDGDGIPDQLDIAEKDENFTDITEVFSPETIYNLRKSPARIARNWFKILATSVIKLNSVLSDIKFSFAEGNKKMTSKGSESCDSGKQELITEGDDIVLNVPNANSDLEPLFTGEIDTLEDYPLSFSSYSLLKQLDEDGVPNYYKMIRYSLTDEDYLYGFIDELRYKPVLGKASFKFRRAYLRDEECSHIYVEEGYVECGYVE